MVRKRQSTGHRSKPGRNKSRRAPGRRQKRGPRQLLDHWAAVGGRLRAAKRIALFLDFDGTLAPISPHPAEAVLAPSTRRVVGRLARHPMVKVWVVSGRRVADVRKRVKVRGVRCIGLHGWERGYRKLRETETYRFIQGLRREVEARLAGFEGVWVEDKFISFVVHYRRATARRKALAALRGALAHVQSKVRVLEGKKVWEILPLEIEGKGAAVRALLEPFGERVLPVYVGDDTTDESAFEALPRGITVRVGTPRRTKARYKLRNPDKVREFLEKLEAEIA